MTENGKPWYRPRLRTLLVMLIAALVLWSGYSYWSEYMEQVARKNREMMAPEVGAYCNAMLDGDVRVEGRFVKLNDQWLVLEQDENSEEIWLARERVLMMKVGE